MTSTSPETVRRFVNNGRSSAEFIAALCQGLKVPAEWMLYGAGDPGAALGGGTDTGEPPTAGGVGKRSGPRRPMPARARA